MSKTPIVLSGTPVGRMKAGWLLTKETWRFLMLDKELLWIPILTSIANVLFFGFLVTLIVAVSFGSRAGIPEDSPVWFGFMFFAYVVGAFILAFSQAAIAHVVYVRAHGGDATLGEGLHKALSHAFSLFVWSLITSTVGIILRIVFERSELLGRIIAAILGSAWSILTYFVVPAMVIDNTSAFTAIPKSARTFKATWGETAVSNISYSLVFISLFVFIFFSGIGLVIAGAAYQLGFLVFFAFAYMFTACFLLCLVSSVFSGILRTLLYIYAVEGTVPANFNAELIEKMLVRKNSGSVSSPTPMQTTV